MYTGADPEKVAITDEIITQIIPLRYWSATSLRNQLLPLFGPDAAVTANASPNALIITDTSARVHRLVQLIQKLDVRPTAQATMDYRQLKHADAVAVARAISQRFDKPAAPTAPAAAVAAAPATAPVLPDRTRLYVDSDARTNTVVLSGPPELVKQASAMIDQLDAAPATAPAGGGLGRGR